jgi:hypothetical protein
MVRSKTPLSAIILSTTSPRDSVAVAIGIDTSESNGNDEFGAFMVHRDGILEAYGPPFVALRCLPSVEATQMRCPHGDLDAFLRYL